MKTLAQYLESSGTTQRQLAAALNISPSFLSEIVTGQKTPSLEVALRIQAETRGKVDICTLVRSSSDEQKDAQ